MNKKLLAPIIIAMMATGCASTNETLVDEVAETKNQEEVSITLDENGFITDEVAIISISEESYFNEMDKILTEDGFSMRVDEVSKDDKAKVLDDNIIYFSFDSSKITDEMKRTIEAQLAFLKKIS